MANANSPRVILQSPRDPSIRYEVLGFNQETGELKLKGRYTTITTSKAKAKAAGYILIREGESNAKPTGVSTELQARVQDKPRKRREKGTRHEATRSPFGSETWGGETP